MKPSLYRKFGIPLAHTNRLHAPHNAPKRAGLYESSYFEYMHSPKNRMKNPMDSTGDPGRKASGSTRVAHADGCEVLFSSSVITASTITINPLI